LTANNSLGIYNFNPSNYYFYNVHLSYTVTAACTICLMQRKSPWVSGTSPPVPTSNDPIIDSNNQATYAPKTSAQLNNFCWSNNLTGTIKVDNALDLIWFSSVFADIGIATNAMGGFVGPSTPPIPPIISLVQITIYRI
jgi:hypothetical protein